MRQYLALAALLFLCGCGSNELKNQPTRPVEIEVFYQGKPLKGARVMLHPIDEKDTDVFRRIRPHGLADEAGKAALTSYYQGDGAPQGEFVVTLSLPARKARGEDDDEGDLLKGRYANPEESQLRVTISSAGPAPKRFDLP